MKIKGREIKGANVEYVVIPRKDGDIVFKCTAILEMKPFYEMCPQPKAPVVMLPGGERRTDVTDTSYLLSVEQHATSRYWFTVIWSLRESDIEYDKVRLTDPNTWSLFEQEFKDAGFSYQEVQQVIRGVMIANSLNESKLEEARTRFLASLAAAAELPLSPKEGQSIMPSGEPLKG